MSTDSHRLGPGGEHLVVGDRPLDRLADHDDRRRRGVTISGCFSAAADGGHGGNRKKQDAQLAIGMPGLHR